jgi:hypothetical protein
MKQWNSTTPRLQSRLSRNIRAEDQKSRGSANKSSVWALILPDNTYLGVTEEYRLLHAGLELSVWCKHVDARLQRINCCERLDIRVALTFVQLREGRQQTLQGTQSRFAEGGCRNVPIPLRWCDWCVGGWDQHRGQTLILRRRWLNHRGGALFADTAGLERKDRSVSRVTVLSMQEHTFGKRTCHHSSLKLDECYTPMLRYR